MGKIYSSIVISLLFVMSAQADSNLKMSAVEAQVLKLGETKQVEVTLESDVEQVVSLSLDQESLTSVKGSDQVSLTLNTQKIKVIPGVKSKFLMNLETRTMAPSFKNKKIMILANDVSTSFNLTAVAVFEVRLFGGASPEKWTSDVETRLAKHTDGVQVLFINIDTKDSHVIHGAGLIPHGNTNKPLEPGKDGKSGGVYEVMVTSQKDNDVGVYYCHVHEGSQYKRTIVFNYKAAGE